MRAKSSIIVIIPAYNEEESILEVVDDLRQNAPFADYIVVNDGSTDATHALLEEHGISHINLIKNLGIGGAVQTGYKYALQHGYDIAIQFDGDGQHCAEYVSDLIAPIQEGEADLVVGSRFKGETDGFKSSSMRRLGITILSGVLKMASTNKVEDVTSGLSAVGRRAIHLFASYYPDDCPEPEALALITCKGLKLTETSVSMRERTGGESLIKLVDSAYHMIKVIFVMLIQADIYERHSN